MLEADAGVMANAGQLIRTQADVRACFCLHTLADMCVISRCLAVQLARDCVLARQRAPSSNAHATSQPGYTTCVFARFLTEQLCYSKQGCGHAVVQEALRRGMESLSQAEVGSALQVYFNLGQLRQVRASCCAKTHYGGNNARIKGSRRLLQPEVHHPSILDCMPQVRLHRENLHLAIAHNTLT